MATFDSGSFSTTHFASTSFDLGAEQGVVRQGQATFLADADVNGYANQQHLVYLTPFRGTAKLTTPREPNLVGGALWKHLWSPIREATVEPVPVKRTSRVQVLVPETFDLRQSAETNHVRVARGSRVGVEAPQTGTMVPAKGVRGTLTVKPRKPRAHAQTPFVRAISQRRVNVLPPVPTVVVMSVPVRRRTYYSYFTPETVQNLTEEQIMMLI